jgi:hypothetical protein
MTMTHTETAPAAKAMAILAVVLMLTTEAHAQQSKKKRTHTGSDDSTMTVYPDGKVQGRTGTDGTDRSDSTTINFGDGPESGSIKITPKPQSKGK